MSTPVFDVLSEKRCFGGMQGFYRYESKACSSPLRFGVFRPQREGRVPALLFLAGLTCSEETFAIKAGAQRMAAERDDIGARLRSRSCRAPSGVTTRMSTSQPPLRYGRIVTLIASYSSGDGARFWSSQSSKSSARRSTRRRTRITPGNCRRSIIA